MAITTLAQVVSGLQYPRYISKVGVGGNAINRHWSQWSGGGGPPAGGFDGTLNGVTLTAPQTGQIPWTDPNAGNAYLARLSLTNGRSNVLQGSFFTLCDRLWHNGGYDVTNLAAQLSTTPTWPARDENGGTTGVGVLIGLECQTSMGAATPTLTISYTNSDGVAGRTGVNFFGTASGSAQGSFYIFTLQAGDVGVRSVESLTFSASWISGTVHLVAFRTIGCLDYGGTLSNAMDAVTGAMPRMFNGSVPFFLNQDTGSSGPTVYIGELQYTWG